MRTKVSDAVIWLDIHVGIPVGWFVYKHLYCYAGTTMKLALLRVLIYVLWAVIVTKPLDHSWQGWVLFMIITAPFAFLETAAKDVWKQMRH